MLNTATLVISVGRDWLIYKAVTTEFGEGYVGSVSGYGVGFKSTNIFDFERDI